MIYDEFLLNSTDGLSLYGQVWAPDDRLKAVVALVHGLGEHSGRYTYMAEYLVRSGYALLAVDLRGHGKSQGRRGHIPSFDVLLDDIGLQLRETNRRFPGSPCFLYGHSLGGNIVVNYGLRRRPQLAGVIATGAAFRPAFKPPGWKLFLGNMLYGLWPSVLMNNELDRQALSRDPQVVQAYQTDPLVHDRLSARLGIDLLRSGEWALAHASEFTLPLLLMHGSEDRIVLADASRQFAERMERQGQQLSGHCTFKLWEGLYHEIHNEPEKEQVLRFIVSWMDHRLNSTIDR